MPGEDDGADSDVGATSVTSSSFTRGLVCTDVGVAPQVCKLCSGKSCDPSPFESAHDGDESSGLHPWLHYKNHPTKPGFKVARGKLCNICVHTFFQSAFAAKHTSIAKCIAYISGRVDRHAPFLKCKK